jgi:hypothetical protein
MGGATIGECLVGILLLAERFVWQQLALAARLGVGWGGGAFHVAANVLELAHCRLC